MYNANYNDNQNLPPATPDRPITRPETVPPLEPRNHHVNPIPFANLHNLFRNVNHDLHLEAAAQDAEGDHQLLMQLDNFNFNDNAPNNNRPRNFSQ